MVADVTSFRWRSVSSLLSAGVCCATEGTKAFALGLEGELATGEELNRLMLDGCRVFHDIPLSIRQHRPRSCQSQRRLFNQHEVTGQDRQESGESEIIVDHQRNIIRFPDRDVTIPMGQLEGESQVAVGAFDEIRRRVRSKSSRCLHCPAGS